MQKFEMCLGDGERVLFKRCADSKDAVEDLANDLHRHIFALNSPSYESIMMRPCSCCRICCTGRRLTTAPALASATTLFKLFSHSGQPLSSLPVAIKLCLSLSLFALSRHTHPCPWCRCPGLLGETSSHRKETSNQQIQVVIKCVTSACVPTESARHLPIAWFASGQLFFSLVCLRDIG